MRQTLIAMLVAFATPAAACELSIGWEDWPPYQYEADGALTGLDVAMIRAIAEEAGCEAVFREMPWARHLKLLAEGGIDLAAAATRTPAREGFAYFSDSYRVESIALLVRRDSDYAGLTGLLTRGGALGVVLGYEYGAAVATLIEGDAHGAQVFAVGSDETNHRKLLAGRIDGMLVDPFVARRLRGTYGGETRIAETLAVNPLHVMFSRRAKTPADVARFNTALSALRESGAHEALMARFGAQGGL